MKFAHMGDCHLGGWRQPELQELNFEYFRHAIDKCIKEKVDFVLVTGDLFDSAYPPIDTIKATFFEFRKLHEARIPVFLIAGSHDYSASGKTFLDVLESAGFIKNAFIPEYKGDDIILQPIIYNNVAIYGYPGKKSGLEVPDIERIKINNAPGLFKILMLHTAIRDAVGTLPIPAVDENKLPKVDYLALSHLHVNYNKNNRVYSGPIFPNNALELEELRGGSFYIVNISTGKISREEIKLKEIIILDLEIKNALTASEKIIEELKKHSIEDKIIILKLKGYLEIGKVSDINFRKVDDYVFSARAYTILRNTTKLQSHEFEVKFEMKSENFEQEILEQYQTENPHKFNPLISQLISMLQLEKKEEEKAQVYEARLMADVKKIIEI